MYKASFLVALDMMTLEISCEEILGRPVFQILLNESDRETAVLTTTDPLRLKEIQLALQTLLRFAESSSEAQPPATV